MSKIVEYLGLSTKQPQPAENNFSMPLIYSGALLVLFVYLAVVQWPEAGIPSQLHQLNPQLDGGNHWVGDEGLSAFTTTMAWATFVWKFLVYLTLAGLLFRLSRTLYSRADFTQHIIRNLRAVEIVLLVGMLTYSILAEVTAHTIGVDTGLEKIEREATFLSDQGLMAVLFLVALYIVEGAMRRGLTLQEESDATI